MNDKLPFVIANLKANKTWEEVADWIDQVARHAEKFSGTIIAAPSHPFLASSSIKIKSSNLPIKLASQDISQFEQGAYTGEVAASQIASLCQFCLLGHSERRQNFTEDEKTLEKKVQNAKAAGIEPIFCVQDEKTQIPQGVSYVAYEPIFAIGTGNPDTPEDAKSVSGKLKAKGNYTVIYGGSVDPNNVKSFLKKDLLDGVLVGTSSLDAGEFIKIIEAAN